MDTRPRHSICGLLQPCLRGDGGGGTSVAMVDYCEDPNNRVKLIRIQMIQIEAEKR